MLYINIKTTMFARSRVCQNCTKIILEHFSQRSLNNLLLGDCVIYIIHYILRSSPFVSPRHPLPSNFSSPPFTSSLTLAFSKMTVLICISEVHLRVSQELFLDFTWDAILFKIDNQIHGRSGWKERFFGVFFLRFYKSIYPMYFLAATVKCHIYLFICLFIHIILFFCILIGTSNAARTFGSSVSLSLSLSFLVSLYIANYYWLTTAITYLDVACSIVNLYFII